MDFMIAYFPLLKFLVTGLLIWFAYYFYIVAKKKWASWFVLFLIIVWIFAPIKYDGTKTKTYHKDTVHERSVQYNNIAKQATIIIKEPVSFEERLKRETDRSKKANNEIAKELQK